MLSQTVLDHSQQPRNFGALSDATGYGEAGSRLQGRMTRLWLRVQDGRIVAAGFRSYPCAAALAAGSVLTEWVVGKGLPEAATMTTERLLAMLEDVPTHRRQGVHLAVAALRSALADHHARLAEARP